MNFPLRDKCEEKAKRLAAPHFTLIASDNHAIATIQHWLELADGPDGDKLPEEKYKETKAIMTAMQDWRALNPTLCKDPD